MQVSKIYDSLVKFCPLEISENHIWDNSGIQLNINNDKISGILICLDITNSVIQELKNDKYNLVVSHHPLIFKPLKSLDTNNAHDRLIIDLIRLNVNVISMHTNLDAAKFGVNYIIGQTLGLKNCDILHKNGMYEFENEAEPYGFGLVGDLENNIKLIDFLQILKNKLQIEHIRYNGNDNRTINKIAVCGGSGGSFIKDAIDSKADVYITGDVGHHDVQFASENNLIIIDAGHFHTEKPVLQHLANYLSKELESLIPIKIIYDNPFEFKII